MKASHLRVSAPCGSMSAFIGADWKIWITPEQQVAHRTDGPDRLRWRPGDVQK